MAEGSGFDLGGRLKSLREAHALSQRELAKRAGVSNAIISMIEQNRSSPSVGMLKKLLDGFPISLAEFFALQEAPKPQRGSWWNWPAARSPIARSAAT